MFLEGELGDLAACGEHQRPHDVPHLIAYSRQAAQSRAAQQIDEEGLDRVVDMVGDGYDRVSVFPAQIVEPCISQPPCRHLHRLARALHLAYGVETFVVAYDAVLAGRLEYHRFVLVTLLPAQLEVAVGHTHVVAAVEAERHEHHRIDASRYREQYLVLTREELVVAYVCLKSLGEHILVFVVCAYSLSYHIPSWLTALFP